MLSKVTVKRPVFMVYHLRARSLCVMAARRIGPYKVSPTFIRHNNGIADMSKLAAQFRLTGESARMH